jgi:hypothetical protein
MHNDFFMGMGVWYYMKVIHIKFIYEVKNYNKSNIIITTFNLNT